MEKFNLPADSEKVINILLEFMAEPMHEMYGDVLENIESIKNLEEGTEAYNIFLKDLESMEPVDIIAKYSSKEELEAFVNRIKNFDKKPLFEKIGQAIYSAIGDEFKTPEEKIQFLTVTLSTIFSVYFEEPVYRLSEAKPPEFTFTELFNIKIEPESEGKEAEEPEEPKEKPKRKFDPQLFGEATTTEAPTLYDYLPSSSMLYLFNSAITHHAKARLLKTTKNGTRQNNRNKTIEYKPEKNGYTLVQKDKYTGDQLELTITNGDKLQGKGIKKCFAFLLTESNKQNFKPSISFPLQELVDRGMYSNVINARAGIKNALDTLQTIKFSGTIKKGKKKTISQSEAGVLFYHYKIKNNYVDVSVNENFNIDFIASYYALIPKFIYALNNSNAFDIAEYIFLQARQNTEAIKTGEPLNISFWKLHELLALPCAEDKAYTEEGKKWKPKQYVIEPILTAIEDIKAEAQNRGNTDFIITVNYNENYKTLEEFLEGYISISFSGEIYSKLCEIATTQEEKIIKAIEQKSKK